MMCWHSSLEIFEVQRETEDGRDWTQFLELAPGQRARKLLRKLWGHEVLDLVQQTVVNKWGGTGGAYQGIHSLI